MTANEIRKQFLDFFATKGHKIVPSAPIVLKDDPTLMFTNSGMVQFKDYFLGNKNPEAKRIADTQKCLRVTGKHNDLEDVGRDSYHQTLFEMLGNWSFGDYFKEEALSWSWELLTEVYKLPKDRLYATVFGGDDKENLAKDDEALAIWKRFLPEDHILYGSKKDNFWEMGDTGPCGPCSEIHIDLRSDEEIAKSPGRDHVNQDNPLVVEIWNNVFMQFERRADRSLVSLPAKHVDTGMGFERLCMAIQGKHSNYDTDLFSPLIEYIEKSCGIKYTSTYGEDQKKTDTAMRVVADHIRAVSFVIADGQLPSNTGAGYVIRRILRRAVRYYFSFLGIKDPFLYRLIPLLSESFKEVFPELKAQQDFVTRVVLEEEKSFLRTLENGLKRLDDTEVQNNVLNGRVAFELLDTFGFPIDLTELIMKDKGNTVDKAGFDEALLEQKTRSRQATARTVGDWVELGEADFNFVGYDRLEIDGASVLKYRTIEEKGQKKYQIVLNITPFYPEGGGQVGDTGFLYFDNQAVKVIDTKKENDLVIHFVEKLPDNIDVSVRAVVDAARRTLTESNHSATHLVHAALREVLGTHVQQRGSFLDDRYLRFDFSHFQKMTDEELERVEKIVNEKIRESVSLQEFRRIPIAQAQESGAMMLFGEKYGEQVRMIVFGESKELCGGCHVKNTGQIGYFKIKSEGALQAGVRRLEALTAKGAEEYINQHLKTLDTLSETLKSPKNIQTAVESLQDENRSLRKQVEQFYILQTRIAKADLLSKAVKKDGQTVVKGIVEIGSADALRQLAQDLRKEVENLYAVIGAVVDGKPQLVVSLSDSLVAQGLDAAKIVRELAKHIQGGGGGQAFLATAGGKEVSGLGKAME